MTIIWCMVPEIWSVEDRIFCHFGLFFVFLPYNNPKNKFWTTEKITLRYHFTYVYHKWQSNDVWFLRYRAQWTEFFVILDNFLLIYPIKTWKIKIMKKWRKKTPGDIILDKCTKNHDHILYCSWDMARGGCKCYFSFWTIFCPFTPLTAWTMKILKEWKKHLEMSSS